MRPIGPDVPPNLRELLTEIRNAILELQNPTQPTQEFAVDAEADLPPAADYPNCRAIIDGDNTLVISTNVAGTWTWLRADGSAI
jgi:hypothetical protein